MDYIGLITCPNCRNPIDSDVQICPYCYSSAPRNAPWNQHRWWGLGLLLGIAGLAWLCDRCFGTNWLEAIWTSVQQRS